MDDQSNGVLSFGDDIEEYTSKLEVNGTLSNSLLNASGGGDTFFKSFCYLFQQVKEVQKELYLILKILTNTDIIPCS